MDSSPETGGLRAVAVPGRFTSLDSLRGVAAFGVVITHTLQHGFPALILNHTPLRLFVNGRCFVIFFFVLSGFVLSMGLLNGNPLRSYKTYLLRRVARIYIPYLAAGVMAILLTVWIQGRVSSHAIFDHLFLIGNYAGTHLNPPSWSLVYEMRISIFLPLLCWGFLYDKKAFLLFILLLFAGEEIGILALGIGQFPYFDDSWAEAIIVTARYTVCFAAGMWLAESVLTGREWLQVIQGRLVPALGLLAFILMSVLLDQTSLIAATLILALALRSAALDRWLNQPVLMWLGHISYSLYLTHLMVITAVMAALHGMVPDGSAAVIGAIASLAFAEIFYRFVEAPSIALAASLKTLRLSPSGKAGRGLKIPSLEKQGNLAKYATVE